MTITGLAFAALALSVALVGYAYVGYPVLLKVVGLIRPGRPRPDLLDAWPAITITIPVYNEAGTIAETLRRVLAIDYPPERRQILVVSDASTDGTDDPVAAFADRGVELLRVPVRGGKTAAENAALGRVRGEIIVNTDASIHIAPEALRLLIAAFADPSVGVASGQDVSVTQVGDSTNQGESRYVGYEMWVRELETRVEGIVGASAALRDSRGAPSGPDPGGPEPRLRIGDGSGRARAAGGVGAGGDLLRAAHQVTPQRIPPQGPDDDARNADPVLQASSAQSSAPRPIRVDAVQSQGVPLAGSVGGRADPGGVGCVEPDDAVGAMAVCSGGNPSPRGRGRLGLAGAPQCSAVAGDSGVPRERERRGVTGVGGALRGQRHATWEPTRRAPA
jgi:hypothetical protein